MIRTELCDSKIQELSRVNFGSSEITVLPPYFLILQAIHLVGGPSIKTSIGIMWYILSVVLLYQSGVAERLVAANTCSFEIL